MHVLITGSGRGVGQALAQLYRAAGHEVTGTARDGSAEVTLDVSEPSQFKRLADYLDDRPVDLVVCNAGVYLDKGHQIETGFDAGLWSSTFAVNVTGVFLTIQTVLPNLRRAEAAKIAIISSQMATQTNAPGRSYIYRSSKAAALNLGRNLAVDLRAEGIAVGIYHPGWVQTDMGGASADITEEAAAAGLSERFADLSLATTGCFETWDGRAHPL